MSKNMVKSSLIYLLSMIIPKVISLVTMPVYSFYLSIEEQGIYTYTQNIITVLSIISVLGLNIYYLRFYNSVDDKKDFNGTFFWYILIWNIILFVGANFFLRYFWKTAQISFDFFPYMFLALLQNLFLSLEIIPMRTYRMRDEVEQYFFKILIKCIISTGISVWLVVGLEMGIIGRYIADVISCFILGVLFIKYMIENSNLSINRMELIKGLKFSLPMLPYQILQVSEPFIKSVIIEKIFSVAKLGVYSIGVSIASIINLLSQSILMAIEPEIYRKADDGEYISFIKKIKGLMLSTANIICLFVGLYIKEVISLFFSRSYLDAWLVVQPLLLSYILSMITTILTYVVIIKGKGGKLSLTNLIYMFITGLGSYLILKKWDVTMLGWTNVVGQIAMIFTIYFLIGKEMFEFKITKDIIVVFLNYLFMIIGNYFNDAGIFYAICIKLIIFIIGSAVVLLLYKIKLQYVYEFIKSMVKQ